MIITTQHQNVHKSNDFHLVRNCYILTNGLFILSQSYHRIYKSAEFCVFILTYWNHHTSSRLSIYCFWVVAYCPMSMASGEELQFHRWCLWFTFSQLTDSVPIWAQQLSGMQLWEMNNVYLQSHNLTWLLTIWYAALSTCSLPNWAWPKWQGGNQSSSLLVIYQAHFPSIPSHNLVLTSSLLNWVWPWPKWQGGRAGGVYWWTPAACLACLASNCIK